MLGWSSFVSSKGTKEQSEEGKRYLDIFQIQITYWQKGNVMWPLKAFCTLLPQSFVQHAHSQVKKSHLAPCTWTRLTLWKPKHKSEFSLLLEQRNQLFPHFLTTFSRAEASSGGVVLKLVWPVGFIIFLICSVKYVRPFLVPLRTNNKGFKRAANITSPFAIIKHVTIIPKIVRLICWASCQKWSPFDPPNHPNQPPPPELPPPLASSLLLISLSHFSNSDFFPPRAPSRAFLASSCWCGRVSQ